VEALVALACAAGEEAATRVLALGALRNLMAVGEDSKADSEEDLQARACRWGVLN
jgi:hypothetical protein